MFKHSVLGISISFNAEIAKDIYPHRMARVEGYFKGMAGGANTRWPKRRRFRHARRISFLVQA
jgi:hypothetical protein